MTKPELVARDLIICPTCHTADFEPLDPDPPFPSVRCCRCDLGIETRLSASPMEVYRRDTYDQARDKGQAVGSWRRFHHDVAVAEARLRQLRDYLPKSVGSWVDVGCNNGAFLTQLRRRGWRAKGVEADLSYVNEVPRLLGVEVVLFSVWMSAPLRAVDVVSFFDVLEHLHDPVGALITAQSALTIVVEVPDRDDVSAGVDAFRMWKHRRITESVTEHIWHFNEKSLSQMLSTYVGGQLVAAIRPCPGRLQMVWQPGPTASVLHKA